MWYSTNPQHTILILYIARASKQPSWQSKVHLHICMHSKLSLLTAHFFGGCEVYSLHSRNATTALLTLNDVNGLKGPICKSYSATSWCDSSPWRSGGIPETPWRIKVMIVMNAMVLQQVFLKIKNSWDIIFLQELNVRLMSKTPWNKYLYRDNMSGARF